jgi:hypothetical protein
MIEVMRRQHGHLVIGLLSLAIATCVLIIVYHGGSPTGHSGAPPGGSASSRSMDRAMPDSDSLQTIIRSILPIANRRRLVLTTGVESTPMVVTQDYKGVPLRIATLAFDRPLPRWLTVSVGPADTQRLLVNDEIVSCISKYGYTEAAVGLDSTDVVAKVVYTLSGDDPTRWDVIGIVLYRDICVKLVDGRPQSKDVAPFVDIVRYMATVVLEQAERIRATM